MEELKLGKYKHFKGKEYEIIGIANHSESLEKLFIYKALNDSEEFGSNTTWARPYDLFIGEKELDGKRVKRFEYNGE